MSKVYGNNWCNHDSGCKTEHPTFPGLMMAKPGTTGACDLRKNKCAGATGGKAKPKANKKKAVPAKKKGDAKKKK